MKRVALRDLQKDVVINQNLYDPRYNILVQKGTIISDKMVETISYYGYLSIFVKTENEKNDEHPSLPFEEINALVKLIKNGELDFTTYYCKRQYTNAISHYKKYIEKRDLFVQKSQRLAEDIILYLVKNQIKVYQIFESKSLMLYGTQHAIQTALLSVLMGIELKLTMQELKILFNSAIMMEFGNIIVPKSILEKQGRLTTEEFELVKTHTAFYSKEFNDCDKMHYLVRTVTQQHHERFNGSGYPLGLKNHEIHPLAQIVMVADTYDALVSDRNQREALTVIEALDYLTGQIHITFHESPVVTLKRIIYPYKVGDIVKLNIGLGTIESFDQHHNPLVRLQNLNKTVLLHPSSNIKILM